MPPFWALFFSHRELSLQPVSGGHHGPWAVASHSPVLTGAQCWAAGGLYTMGSPNEQESSMARL